LFSERECCGVRSEKHNAIWNGGKIWTINERKRQLGRQDQEQLYKSWKDIAPKRCSASFAGGNKGRDKGDRSKGDDRWVT